MKKALIIFNPVAGVEEAGHYLPVLVDQLTRLDYLPMALATQKEGDEAAFAERWGDQVDLLICLGGDGTLSQLVSSLIHLPECPDLGYIPTGSTNDFAKGVGMSGLDQKALIDLACQGKASLIDIGKFNEDSFIYVAAFGLFTAVSYRTPQNQKNLLGRLAYFFEGIRDLGQVEDHFIRISYDDGEVEGNFVLGMISNSNSVAGFTSITDYTDYSDGLFEVILVKSSTNPLDMAGVLHDLLAGQENDLILRFKTTQIHLSSDYDLAWTLDGEEGFKGKEAHIEVLPSTLPIRIPLEDSEIRAKESEI